MSRAAVIPYPGAATPETMDRWHRLVFLMAFMSWWHGYPKGTWNVTEYGPLFEVHRQCRGVAALRASMARAGW